MHNTEKCNTFATPLRNQGNMVAVVQLVRASDCGSECRRFESDQPPQKKEQCFFFFYLHYLQKIWRALIMISIFFVGIFIYSAFVARRIPRRFGAAVSTGFSCCTPANSGSIMIRPQFSQTMIFFLIRISI